MAATALANDVIAQLIPGGDPGFVHVSDNELLANTRRLVGRSNQLLAALLAHLAEVEARGAHRSRSCASLYTYCIYELRFSEDAAARRSAAARFAKEFPILLNAVTAGELHLTGLLMIGPHLTAENHESVLARAKFRTKKELTKLVRELSPLSELPDRIEPMGAEPRALQAARNPSWQQAVAALSPPVRELPAGERPCDWANDGAEAALADALSQRRANHDVASMNEDALPVGPVPSHLPPVTGPQLFQLQFSSVEEHVQLIERAKALLARERPRVTLGELHLEAMRLLVAALEKRKFAVTSGPRSGADSTAPQRTAAPTIESPPRVSPPSLAPSRADLARQRRNSSDVPRQRGDSGTATEISRPTVTATAKSDVPRRPADSDAATEISKVPRQRGDSSEEAPPANVPRQRADADDAAPRIGTASRRSRYVAAVVRREVYRRDGGRCSFVDARGERCCETWYLELHHLQAFARGGGNSASNLALRCAAHNSLAAEADFGRRYIVERRSSTRHEAAAAQTRVRKPPRS